MGTLIEQARRKILLEMYASVEKMNKYIADNNPEGAMAEQQRQRFERWLFTRLEDHPRGQGDHQKHGRR